jgi:hypothetical protein
MREHRPDRRRFPIGTHRNLFLSVIVLSVIVGTAVAARGAKNLAVASNSGSRSVKSADLMTLDYLPGWIKLLV